MSLDTEVTDPAQSYTCCYQIQRSICRDTAEIAPKKLKLEGS